MKKKILLAAAWMIGITGISSAQSKDSLAALATFINVFDMIRQPPVNIRMMINSSSDVQLSPENDFSMEADIHLRKAGSYARFGEMEQLVNDSMVMTVNDSLEQIILLPGNGRSLKDQWAGMPGIGRGDSSVKKLNSLYKAEVLKDAVRLQSRSFLSGTGIAKESVQLDLDARTKLPTKLLISRRTLVLVDSLQMEELKQQHIPAERFVQRGKVIYLVKETQTRFSYLHIDQENKPLPATVANRVEKDAEGQWKPVKAYEGYRLINQTNE